MQEESFKVLSGKMGYFWENETGTAEVGEVLTIPAGVRHTFFSADPEQPLEFEVTLRPAVRLRLVSECCDAASPDRRQMSLNARLLPRRAVGGSQELELVPVSRRRHSSSSSTTTSACRTL